jgi:DNA-directed RNA polymerase sigma subunit (sigma70/sigma32)
MKYAATTKTERNQSVVKMHSEHPELAYQEIAVEFGISRARIAQILNREKLRELEGKRK